MVQVIGLVVVLEEGLGLVPCKERSLGVASLAAHNSN